MTLNEIVRHLGLKVKVGGVDMDTQVRGGYASDLLSDVLANARVGDLWVTLQTHQNTVAVASMKEIAGILLVGGRQPESDTMTKAAEEGVALLVTPLPAFEVVGRLYQLGLSGTDT